MPDKPNCGNCRFWDIDFPESPDCETGRCQVDGPRVGLKLFPDTPASTWCGKHEPIAKTDKRFKTYVDLLFEVLMLKEKLAISRNKLGDANKKIEGLKDMYGVTCDALGLAHKQLELKEQAKVDLKEREDAINAIAQIIEARSINAIAYAKRHPDTSLVEANSWSEGDSFSIQKLIRDKLPK